MTGGFDAEALAQAPHAIDRAIEGGDLAGAVTLVWRRGEVAQLACRGRRSIEADLPMERDTLFRIASMTKPVTSAAVLMLIDEGKLALGDPITRWAPEFADMRVLAAPDGPLDDTFPAPRQITVEDLLTHRAGLAYGFTSAGPLAKAHDRAMANVFDTDESPDIWLKALGSLPLSFPPGERFHYSHATDVLGFIVGRIATGRAGGFRDFLLERIFAPLGMVDTDFFVPPAKRQGAAELYRLNDDLTALEPVAFRQRDAPPVFCGGGAGLISTADDFLAFARMLLGGGEVDSVRLLKEESVRQMQTNRLTDAQRQIDFMGFPFWAGQGFGLGLSMVIDPEKQAWMGAGSVGALGWPGAWGTWWQADPEQDMILIFMIQNALPLGRDAAAQLATGQRLGARVALPLFQKAVYGALTRLASVGWPAAGRKASVAGNKSRAPSVILSRGLQWPLKPRRQVARPSDDAPPFHKRTAPGIRGGAPPGAPSISPPDRLGRPSWQGSVRSS